MRALFRHGGFSERLIRLGFTRHSHLNLTIGKEYEIFAVVMWSEVIFFCVVSDLDLPSWIPSTLFSVTDGHLRSDWLFAEFDDEVAFVLGPDFIAKSKEAYGALVELKSDAVERFWKYIDV